MTDSASVQIQSVLDLLGVTELVAIHFIEFHAERVGAREVDDDEGFRIQIARDQDDQRLSLSFRLRAAQPQADYIVAVQTVYSLPEACPQVGDDVLNEFTERVAVMAAYPFLRQGIATLAATLEMPVPILGLLRAGSFTFAAEPPEDASQV